MSSTAPPVAMVLVGFRFSPIPPEMGPQFTVRVRARAVVEPGRSRLGPMPDKRPEVREGEATLSRGQQSTWALPIAQYGIVVVIFSSWA